MGFGHGRARHLVKAMTRLQGGFCGICGRKPEKSLCVDHDHRTGRLRGMLCVTCNFGLGSFKDSAELLRFAADYLEQSVNYVPPAPEEPARCRQRSLAARAAISAGLKKAFSDPVMRSKISRAVRAAMASPEVRQRIKDGIRKAKEERLARCG